MFQVWESVLGCGFNRSTQQQVKQLSGSGSELAVIFGYSSGGVSAFRHLTLRIDQYCAARR